MHVAQFLAELCAIGMGGGGLITSVDRLQCVGVAMLLTLACGERLQC
jgi:hypothetical protein